MFGHKMYLLVVLYSIWSAANSQDVDGGWNSWMEWSTCSVSCGHGYHVRSRICDSPEPSGNGTNCTGTDYDTRSCELPHCPVDGDWGSWEEWRGCTTTCGYGVTFRTRHCDNPAPAYNGSDCVGTGQGFSKCFDKECPVDGGWTNWSDFGECSSTCGFNRIKERSRNCTNPAPAFGGQNCTGDENEKESCDFVDCKDGTWNSWGEWGECSATCGTSVHFRFRNCTLSTANNGTCDGREYVSGLCSSFCPVDGNWASWEKWSDCSSTCEQGTRTRLRKCVNPTPAHGGKDCEGISSQTENCTNPTFCPIDGGWTEWEEWSQCDKSCDLGYQVRLRRCANPPPYYNGKPCDGKDIEPRECNKDPCPVNGNWTNWFPWSPCSVSCGTGTKSRLRTCSNPKPLHGGDYCVGEFEETSTCKTSDDPACPVDGGWTVWGNWSSCSITCGTGTITRSRSCTNPPTRGTGKPCDGLGVENKTCSVATDCPVDGGWSTWRAWYPCSVTCGAGTQTRLRTCSNPKPQHGGKYCEGEPDENKNCTAALTCTDGGDAALVG
ncbi:coadhesin-like [Mercenaria mercenaria]|uniref:coadhesin-like n=1 Tax=Mercenaria mercenaria TaxID=6596 RepID=UPI00234E6BB3|nr:coadhesin-like [Mercenaria mercenaria]